MGLEKNMKNVGVNVLNTKRVNEIMRKENLGMKISISERLWADGSPQVRKANLSFAMTDEELNEYIKCKLSVHYFAQKYCKIKREDGTIGNITLRDYQSDIISLFDENRYSILMASRQIGKCVSLKTKVLVKIKDEVFKKTLGFLYYLELNKIRKLSLMEKIKFKIYSIL